MTIEQQISEILGFPLEESSSFWSWYGVPRSKNYATRSAYSKVDKLISEAAATECMLSPIEYVRECKKWYLKNGE